ncbi:MAG: sensor histidine kinase [Nocardioidaceae bacterium]
MIALAVVSLAFMAGVAVLLGLLRAELERSRDAAAHARVEELAALAATDAAPPTLTVPDEDDVSQVVDSAGTVIAGSPGHKDKPVASFESGVGETLVQDVPQIRDGQELESFRVWAMTVEGPEGPVTAYFAVSKESVDEILSTLRSLLVTGLPLLLVAFGFSAWFLLGRALRPVEQIRAEVDNITAEALNRRVPQPKTDDEIGRLATTMNTMLDRLQASNAQQRQLLADVAHELQSPLTAFRTQLEVALADLDATDWPEVSRELLRGNQEMEGLVRDLLFMARMEETQSVRQTGLLDLDDIVLEEVARARPAAQVLIQAERVSAAPMHGNGEELRRMTRNVLENALRHASNLVEVELSRDQAGTRLAIRDDGAGLPESEQERVFDRFVRGDAARRRDDRQTGLGLAIVKSIVERHGGAVHVEAAQPGARFVIWFPG